MASREYCELNTNQASMGHLLPSDKMKWIFTIVGSLLISFTYSQEIEIEMKEETFPCEDQLNIEGAHYKNALSKGVKILQYAMSDCDQSASSYQLKDRVSSIRVNSDQLTICLQLTKNCCTGTRSSIEIVAPETWNFIIEDQENGCADCFCHCCFSAEFQVENKSGVMPNAFLLNGDSIAISDTAIIRE